MKIANGNLQLGTEGGQAPMKYVSVLTPPLLVCAAFLIGLYAFLRHEMGGRRASSEDLPSDDISDEELIPRSEPDTPSEGAAASERRDDN
jgi:hypothetical protein